VYSIPSVAVISTGDELVEPNKIPGKSQIRNSNAWQIMAQTAKLGYNPEYMGIVMDNESSLLKTLTSAINKYQIILISGGVSVGDYDFVPKVLKQIGADIVFHGLEAKPGKHILFGRKENCLVFGLPGNPVSSFIQFELLISPLLIKLKGFTEKSKIMQLALQDDYKRKKADTLSFIPGRFINNNEVFPVEYHGSAHIHSYSTAQCIIEIPKGVTEIIKGTLVNVRPL
jgi:molybdopterin molybdotransferase